MRAGRLRHRLKLQQQVITRDSYGAAIITWTTTATVWGAVEALWGKESVVTDQQVSDLTVRIIIRYDSSWSAIDTKWRIEDANTSRKYDIKTVILPEQRSRPNTVIEFQCVEGQSDDE